MRTHFKPTETFQYTHFASCHPQGVKKDFIKGEAIRLLRTNSSKIIFEGKITNFKAHLLQRGYPEDLINTTLSEVNFKDRKLVLQQKPRVLQGFTRIYRGLQAVTWCYSELRGVTGDYKGLQKTCSQTRTCPDSFSRSKQRQSSFIYGITSLKMPFQ